MLNNYNRISFIYKLAEYFEQHTRIFEVQSRGRLIEDVNGFAGLYFRELGRKLNPLSLSARQRRRLLSQTDVAEPYVIKGFELAFQLRYRVKELECLSDGHFKHV